MRLRKSESRPRWIKATGPGQSGKEKIKVGDTWFWLTWTPTGLWEVKQQGFFGKRIVADRDKRRAKRKFNRELRAGRVSGYPNATGGSW